MSRRLTREKTLQILYQINLSGVQPEEAIASVLNLEDKEDISNVDINYINNIVNNIVSNLDTIDRYITKHSKNWNIERIALIDKNILRIAIYEMYYMSEEIPIKVSINEAIYLTKIFSTEKAGNFINGILDSIKKAIEKNEDEIGG